MDPRGSRGWTALVVLAFLPHAAAHPQVGPIERERLEFGETLAWERRDRILEEIALLRDHPWAGTYKCGSSHVQVEISIAPESGVVYTMEGCIALLEFNHGDVLERDGVITVDWARDPDTIYEHFRHGLRTPYLSRQLIPVRWGSTRLLFPESDVGGFCAQVNAGHSVRRFPSDTRIYSRMKGRPGLPAAYSSLVLDRPVDATLDSLEGPLPAGKDANGRPRVFFRGRIDAGQAHGVGEGLILSAFDHEGFTGIVLRAEGRSGTVHLRRRVLGNPLHPFRSGHDPELAAWVGVARVQEVSRSAADTDGFRWIEAQAEVSIRPDVCGDPDRRLLEGSMLRIVGAYQHEAFVVAVDETTAEIEIRGEGGDRRSLAPSVGWRVTSWGAGPPP